jgi:large subunit ribosomal protein L23
MALFSKKQAATQGELAEKKAVQDKVYKASGSAYRVLIRPIASEKAALMADKGVYCFEVAPTANRAEIKKAFAALYGVTPTNVNTVNMNGKVVRRGRHTGRRKDWKKAFVSVKEGDKVNVFEGV